jgi:hypothetical protein
MRSLGSLAASVSLSGDFGMAVRAVADPASS